MVQDNPPPADQALLDGGAAIVFVTDMDRSVRFYTETLGLKLLHRAGDEFTMIDAGHGLVIGLHPPSKLLPPPGTNGSVQIGFNTTGAMEHAVQTLQSQGVTFRQIEGNPIVDDGFVKLAFFADPDGHELYLCEAQ